MPRAQARGAHTRSRQDRPTSATRRPGPSAPPGRALALVALFLAGFVLAHPLGHAIGAWPAVLLVAVVVGGVSCRFADAPATSARRL